MLSRNEGQGSTSLEALDTASIDECEHKPELIFPCQSAAIAARQAGQD